SVFEGDPVLLYARGMFHERAGRVDEALADLQLILDEQPDSFQALNAYGYTLLVHGDRVAEALPYLERALELAPESAAVLDSLGWARFLQGRHQQALDLLRRAWAREPMAEIAAHLGEVLWVLGRQDEARGIWREGLRLSDSDPTLNQTLDRLLEHRTP
ncbi:tetratricopeptide repeat protein, partial [Arenimonas caeni]